MITAGHSIDLCAPRAPALLPRPPKREYPRVTIWLAGQAQTSGGLWTLYMYRSLMHRILVRPFRFDPSTMQMRYSATFYWQDGAWSSVCFNSLDELELTLNNVATRILRWPEAELMT